MGLRAQALTTSVAVWYGVEAFNLRSKEPSLDDQQPPGMLPPPPKNGDSAMPGAYSGYQQVRPLPSKLPHLRFPVRPRVQACAKCDHAPCNRLLPCRA